MAQAEEELEKKLMESGNAILSPPSSKKKLLALLNQVEKFLTQVEQSPSESMKKALCPSTKALIADDLLRHSDDNVKVAVASCISEITRITAPDAPYEDDQMKEVFGLIVSSFEKLDDIYSSSYIKRTSILETVAKVRSCVVMLDLECDSLIIEMFQHFLRSIREYHPKNIFSSMETIMTLVLEESEEVSVELLLPILDFLKRPYKEVLPISRELAVKVIEKCADKVKPNLLLAVETRGGTLYDYSRVVGKVCGIDSDALKPKDRNTARKNLVEKSDIANAPTEKPVEVAMETVDHTPPSEEVGPTTAGSPKSVVSNGNLQKVVENGSALNGDSKEEDRDANDRVKSVAELSKPNSEGVETGELANAESNSDKSNKEAPKSSALNDDSNEEDRDADDCVKTDALLSKPNSESVGTGELANAKSNSEKSNKQKGGNDSLINSSESSLRDNKEAAKSPGNEERESKEVDSAQSTADAAENAENENEPDAREKAENEEEPDAAEQAENAKEPDAAELAENEKEPEAAEHAENEKEPNAAEDGEIQKESDAAENAENENEPDAREKAENEEEPDAAELAENEKEPEAAEHAENEKEPNAAEDGEIQKESDAENAENENEPDARGKVENEEEPDAAELAENEKEPNAAEDGEIQKESDAAEHTENEKDPKAAEDDEIQKESEAAEHAENEKEPYAAEDADIEKESDAAEHAENEKEPHAAEIAENEKESDTAERAKNEKEPDVAEHVENEKEPDAAEHTENKNEHDATEHAENEKEPDAEKHVENEKEPDAAEHAESENEHDATEHAENEKEPDAAEHTENENEHDATEHAENEKEPDAEEHVENEKEPDAAEHAENENEHDATEHAENEKEPDAAEHPENENEHDATEHAENEKEPDAAVCSPKTLENEPLDVPSPSSCGSPDKNHSKRGVQVKRKDEQVQETEPAGNIDSKNEFDTKKATEGSRVSKSKVQKRKGKKFSSAAKKEDSIPSPVHTSKKEDEDADKLDERSVKQSGKKVEAVSSQREDKKKRGQTKGTPAKDLAKTTSREDEKTPVPKSVATSSKDEGDAEKTPKAGSKRKQSPREEKASATKGYGAELIGKKVKVWWPVDKAYYEGVVDSFDSVKIRHKVVYVDGDVEILKLGNELWEFIEDDSPPDQRHASDAESLDESAETPKRKKAKAIGDPGSKQGKIETITKKGGASSNKSKSTPKSGRKQKDDIKADSETKEDASKSISKSNEDKAGKLKDLKGGNKYEEPKSAGKSKNEVVAKVSNKSKLETPKGAPKSKGKSPKTSTKSNTISTAEGKADSSSKEDDEAEDEEKSPKPTKAAENIKGKSPSATKSQKSGKKRKRGGKR